jgi:hypothetical protein
MLLVSRDQTAFAALQGNVAPILVPPPAAIFGRPTPLPTITPQTLPQDDGRADKPQAVALGTRPTPILVIFCTGQCFAVDQSGVRTPAPKGTTLREGQRLETGPGAYAQLKLGPDAALAVAERAQVRFDQRSVPDRDVVYLDQGRIRMLSGEALGGPEKREVELRTTDGIFALRGADIELRKPPVSASGDSGLTIVNLNAGDARLLNPGGEIAIAKGGVQGFTAGKVVTDKPISLADVALAPSRPGVAAIAPAAPASTPVRDIPVVTGADKVMLTRTKNLKKCC